MPDTASVPCPYCGQTNEVALDPTAGSQEFTTDCEVCCHPFTVRAEIEDGGIIGLETGAG